MTENLWNTDRVTALTGIPVHTPNITVGSPDPVYTRRITKIMKFNQVLMSKIDNLGVRCPECDLPCKSLRGIKIHQSRVHKPENPQSFQDRLVGNQLVYQNSKVYKRREKRSMVHCGEKTLESVFGFCICI